MNIDISDEMSETEKIKYNQGFIDGYKKATEQANAVIKDIKTEIKSLIKEQETHFDVLEVGANRAFCRSLSIIDRHIRKGANE